MENINKQIVYVHPNPNGWCLTYSYSAKYADQPGWYQAFVDNDHLAGFGSQPFTVRYDFKDGTLKYPKNWPADQSDQIKNLTAQLNKAVKNGNKLSQIVLSLQEQLAAIQGKKGDK